MYSILSALLLMFTAISEANEISKKLVSVSALRKNCAFAVYVPRFTPSGFKITKALMISEQGVTHEFSPNYTIEYCNTRKDCYTIESGSEFGSGPDGSKRIKGSSKLFGTFYVYFFPPNTEGNASTKNYVLSSWLANKRDTQRRYHLFSNGISLNDARKIIESLEVI